MFRVTINSALAGKTAKQLVGEYDVELWHDSRIVARLDAPKRRNETLAGLG
jgi:hypothetical protein